MANAAHAYPAVDAPAPAIGPTQLADAILAAALELEADRVRLLASPAGPYIVVFTSRGAPLATATLAAALGAATVARFALITDVDVTAARATSGTTRIRRGRDTYDIVFTLRPSAPPAGTEPARRYSPRANAELVLAPRTQRRARGTGQPYGELAAGTTVGHYRVVERVGAGGMGEVYRVEHATLGRRYALKVLHRDAAERDPQAVARFVREARAASRIRHPHIVDVFDFGYLEDGRPYLVMELLAGTSLGDRIDRHGALPPREAVAIARQLASALGAAHAAGVVHADVTPSNILLPADGGGVKLFDFGLAQLCDTAAYSEPRAGFIMGTPSYVSPEQLRGARATAASDQYALGVVLYEMLAGAPPFVDPSLPTLCRQHVYDPPPPVASPYGDVAPDLEDIVARCLGKTPAARFADMAELAAALGVLA